MTKKRKSLENEPYSIIEKTLSKVRSEYTIMPRFGYHQPLDYHIDTFPVDFEDPIFLKGEPLPLPPIKERMGYSSDDRDFLQWGSMDKGLLISVIEEYIKPTENISVFDFGCSSGRVLRHFYPEALQKGWSIYGSDIQARPIQWMRENFPDCFTIFTGSTMPHLPLEDNSLDVIYGFSVFTHIKYHWDMWLLELKRVLKPGGIMIQTIHSEHAWKFYYDHKDQDWVINNHSAKMLEVRDMPHDYFFYGDLSVSQVFYKREIARKYWQRYFTILNVLPPPQRSFQDWMICQKPTH